METVDTIKSRDAFFSLIMSLKLYFLYSLFYIIVFDFLCFAHGISNSFWKEEKGIGLLTLMSVNTEVLFGLPGRRIWILSDHES
jgi:hypothetical protein